MRALVVNLLRLVVEERPLRYLALPGIALLIVGMLAAIYMVSTFDPTEGMLSIHTMIVTLGATVTGLLLILAAFQVYSLHRIRERITDLGDYHASRTENRHESEDEK